jgi:hypothetical protein
MSELIELPPVLEAFGADLAQAGAHARPTHRRRPLLGIVAMTAAATATVLLIAFATRGQDATSDAAAAPLLQAARAALRQPSLFPRNDQYLYVETEGQAPAGMSIRTQSPAGGGVTAIERVITSSWKSAGRPPLAHTRVLSLEFASRADAVAWRANGGTKVGSKQTYTGSPPHAYLLAFGRSAPLTRRQVLALPRSPRALLARTIEYLPGARAWLASLPGSGAPVSEHVTYTYTYSSSTAAPVSTPQASATPDGYLYAEVAFSSIWEDFQDGLMPPWLRSALYRALTLIPGVHYAGIHHDLVGRSGAEVTFVDLEHRLRDELIFDPATSALLDERQVLLAPSVGFPAGTAIEDLAFLHEAVTDSTTIPHARELH